MVAVSPTLEEFLQVVKEIDHALLASNQTELTHSLGSIFRDWVDAKRLITAVDADNLEEELTHRLPMMVEPLENC